MGKLWSKILTDLDLADDIAWAVQNRCSSTSSSRTTTDKSKSIFQICLSAQSLD